MQLLYCIHTYTTDKNKFEGECSVYVIRDRMSFTSEALHDALYIYLIQVVHVYRPTFIVARLLEDS